MSGILTKEAKLIYRDGYYDILEEGEFVKCAVSGKKILLDDLRYWSVDSQQAFFSCAESLEIMGKQIYVE